MKKYILSIGVSLWYLSAIAQLSTVIPAKPLVSDTITVSYNSTLTNAKLNGQEPIYVRVTSALQDGSIEKFHRLLLGKALIAKLVLPKLTASSKFEFYTLNKEDEAATKKIIIYQEDRERPVIGAYLEDLFSSKPDSIFQLALANHPTNYYAYAKYINVVAMINDPIIGKERIKALLANLNHIALSNQNNAGLMAAICVANAKIGELALAKQRLYQLFDAYPLAAETAFAFSIYNYEYYKASNKQIEEDVRLKIRHIFINFPTAAVCKNANVFEYLRKDLNIPTSAFEKAILPQYESDGIVYYALGNLPELYIDRKEKLTEAKLLLQQAIDRFQSGTIQHQFRLSNGHFQMYVPVLLLDLAKVNNLQKDNQSALLNLSAAIQTLTGSNAEGNFMPIIQGLRAKVFTEMGNFNLAFEDYKQLYLKGETNVLDSMQRLFPLCNLKKQSFNDFLATLKPLTNMQSVSQNKLEDLIGTDLKGNKVRMSDLKGKIVVVNVWGISCGPCIAEMPELNELVKLYQNRPEVVFLAVTADQHVALVKFFKTRVFNYKVLAEVGNISEVFNTNALPVHMVLGKNGEIINRSIGAREDIKAYLKGIIEANL